jgi:membrane associated rhomboid family serine protease
MSKTISGIRKFTIKTYKIMKALILSLRILSVAFIAVSAMHLFMGMYADASLGAPVTDQMAADPSFDSQNRFYGITFSLLGIVLLIGTTDMRRYKPMVIASLAVLFAAGIARAIAWMLHGAPSPAIIGILCADIILPPIFYLWMNQSLKESK